ncbi:MAG: hypothetical protein MI974_03805 [Chitinophagales bacterium]|nr:hypothetical protein [Chitinophagales bacterium]
MKNKLNPAIAAILIGTGWVLIQELIFYFRFGRFNFENFLDLVVFFLAGLISGGILLFVLSKSKDSRQRKGTIIGYLLSLPLTWLLCIIGGLILPPYFGIILFGSVLPLIGVLVGSELTQ